MGLNKQKGNMYLRVIHTWSSITGKCPHNSCDAFLKWKYLLFRYGWIVGIKI